ncbi:MAG: hypothetical protein WCK49_10175 [Myxococcaceae bacterium]
MNKLFLFLCYSFLISSLSYAEVTIAHPGSFRKAFKTIDRIFKSPDGISGVTQSLLSSALMARIAQLMQSSFENSEKIDKEVKDRDAKFNEVLNRDKSDEQVLQERRGRIRELKEKIQEVKYTLKPAEEQSAEDLWAELYEIIGKPAWSEFHSKSEDKNEIMFDSQPGVLEQPVVSTFYVVPGIMALPGATDSKQAGAGSLPEADKKPSDCFPSPERVVCSSPFMREVFHEEKDIEVTGLFGEECLNRLFRIYAACKPGVKILKLKTSSDRGVDRFVVDNAQKIIIFLEAKCCHFEAQFKKKEAKALEPQILGLAGEVPRGEIDKCGKLIEQVTMTLLKSAKKTANTPMTQFSRKWCEDRVCKLEGTEEVNHLMSMIKEGCRFIRLASLTIVSKEPGNPKRAVTYYSVVRDGYSDRPKTDNPEERIRMVDGKGVVS